MYAAGFRKKPVKKTYKNKARSRVSPWRNREEFEDVYLKIFGSDATWESKQAACERLHIWKIRRGAETPACILGTLTLLEVELQDNGDRIDSTLSHVYSSAFIRFLNCVTSIVDMKGKKKTMYVAARDLGLESHIVDLRHLCSHGRTLPTLEVFRSSTAYCMNWVKSFYWERELQVIEDTDAQHLKRHNATRFVKNLRKYFIIYDAVTQSIHNGIEEVDKISSVVENPEHRGIIDDYVTEVSVPNIEKLHSHIIRDLIKASKSRIIHENVYYFANELLNSPYFVSVSCRQTKKIPVVQLHQKLLYEIMRNGYLDKFFYRCIFIAEDRFESKQLRRCAAFWIDKILEGLELMNKIGPTTRDEFESLKELNISERKAYKELSDSCQKAGVDTNETLIVHNFIINPIEIQIDDQFVEDRLEESDFVSAIYVQRLLNFVKNEEKKAKFQKLVDFISIFKEDTDENGKYELPAKRRKIFTVEDDLKPLLEAKNLQKVEQRNKFGLWRVETGIDWKNIPLGYVFGVDDVENKEE